MKRLKSRLGILLLAVAIVCVSIYAEAKNANLIQSYISEFEHKTKCNSMNIVVYDEGKISYYGNTNRDALYQIGSMTKAFTGLGIMKLIQEGKIIPDNKVSDYLSGFAMYYEGKKADILVKDLLSQTSGFINSERDYPSAKK